METVKITPIKEKHAIEVMAIGIEWQSPADATVLRTLRKVYEDSEDVKEFLPSLGEVQAFSFNINSPGSVVAQNNSGSFDIRRFDAKGSVCWAVSVRPELISCNCTDYDRWHRVKPQSLKLLTPFIEAMLNTGNQINAIGLQYQDAFKMESGMITGAIATLLRADSPFIPPHFIAKDSLWHSHQGWFSIGNNEHRMLNNVNVDVHEVNDEFFVRINGQHRVLALTPDGKSILPISRDSLYDTLDFLHQKNKDVLRGLIVDDMLKRIGFDSGAGE